MDKQKTFKPPKRTEAEQREQWAKDSAAVRGDKLTSYFDERVPLDLDVPLDKRTPQPKDTAMDAVEQAGSLSAIADIIQYWIDWTARQHEAESIPVDADTHVWLNGYEGAPPHWPSVGQLKRWVAALRSTTPAPECPSCGGLNVSCPDGCGRDPKTGELNGTRLAPAPEGLRETLCADKDCPDLNPHIAGRGYCKWAKPSPEEADYCGIVVMGDEPDEAVAIPRDIWLKAGCPEPGTPVHDALLAALSTPRDALATLKHIRELLVAYGPRYIEKAVRLADAALAIPKGDR